MYSKPRQPKKLYFQQVTCVFILFIVNNLTILLLIESHIFKGLIPYIAFVLYKLSYRGFWKFFNQVIKEIKNPCYKIQFLPNNFSLDRGIAIKFCLLVAQLETQLGLHLGPVRSRSLLLENIIISGNNLSLDVALKLCVQVPHIQIQHGSSFGPVLLRSLISKIEKKVGFCSIT